jgi:hypothetical protein
MNGSDIEALQIDLNRLGDWVVQNAKKINPGKSKTLSFTSTRVKNLLNYCFGDQRIPEANSCQYLGIILRNDLNWTDQVNYTVRKAWKAHNFIVRVLIKESSNTKNLAYTSLVRPFLEYGASCWYPYKECPIK